MKQKIHFSSVINEAKPSAITKVENYQEGKSKGIRMKLMLFSTAWNRNHAYFQVSDLLRWTKKTGKVMFNFNHDLSETDGQYLGNTTKIIDGSMYGEYNDGAFEVFATVESTDPNVVSRYKEITAPSIELEIETEFVKTFDDGSGYYFTNYELAGVAFLTGLLAGSGDARIEGDVSTFSLGDNSEQVERKPTDAKANFAETVDKYGSKTTSDGTYKTDDGKVYRVLTESEFTTLVQDITQDVTNGIIQFMDKKQDDNTDDKKEEVVNDGTNFEASLDKASETVKKEVNSQDFEQVPDRDDTGKVTRSKSLKPSFFKKFIK